MKVVLTTAIFLTIIATPALAQTHDPNMGPAKKISNLGQYASSGNHRSRYKHGYFYERYLQTPDYGFHDYFRPFGGSYGGYYGGYFGSGAGAECFCRVIHRPLARRVAQRDAVPLTPTYPCGARSLACGLQHQSAPLAARVDEPGHLRSGPAVRCAALHRRLRSADRRYHRPTGQCRSPDSNRQWIKLGGNVTPIRWPDRSPSAWRSGKTCEAKRFFSRCWRSLVRIRLRSFSIEDPATEGDPRSAAKDKITSPSRGGESSLAPIQSIDRELGCCDQLCLSFDQGNPESGRTYVGGSPAA